MCLRSSVKTKTEVLRYFSEREITFQCPGCLAMETLFFENGQLTGTKHWIQFEGSVYHRNCKKPSQAIDINRSKQKIFLPANNTDHILLKMLISRGKKPSQIAREVGVNPITVKRWLSGKCYPNLISRQKLVSYGDKIQSGRR